MGLITVSDGISLYVQDTGTGPTVVLVAGFGMSYPVWDRLVRILSADHRVICVDQRGHGLSDKPVGGYDIDQLAQDLIGVLELLDVTCATLVGWSLGGQTAFRAVTLDAGRRISQLVLVGSNAVRASRSDRFPFGRVPEQMEPALVGAECEARIASRRQTIRSGFAGEVDEDTMGWLLAMSLQMPSWAAVALYHSMFYTDLIDDLGSVTIPVLQIIGAQDPVHSAKGARWLNACLPNATLVELPECGHYPMLEAPEAFERALRQFIAAR